jgi:hypothetical protein
MNKDQKNLAILASAAALYVAVDYLKIRAYHLKIRKDIRAAGEKDITAIQAAAEHVKRNINNGEYRFKGLDAVRSDLKFYEMIEKEF